MTASSRSPRAFRTHQVDAFAKCDRCKDTRTESVYPIGRYSGKAYLIPCRSCTRTGIAEWNALNLRLGAK